MMNRGVMDRQMFAKGGAAFPDLNKDGNITQADILMGRGVEFKQEGGIAGMMPPALMQEPEMGIQEAATQVDPAVIEQALSGVSQDIGNLENMDNLEDMMNAIRGDDATVEERYDELAGVVGEEDAAKTPESVLALVQPVMMLNAVDQGIGGLAQEEMTQEVAGPMAEGIMSTVASPPASEPAPMPMEGPPPVNFKNGGLVRRGDNQPVIMMQEGGDPIAQAGRLGELYQQKMPLYTSILGDPSAGLEDQKRLTEAQMLFDIANTALAFSAPMEGERPGMSAAERLAMAARTTQLPQTIGARAQAQLDKEAAVRKEEQQMKLAALGAAETGLAAEAKAASDKALQELKGAQSMAEITLKDKLSSASAQVLKAMDIQGDITVENVRQANRVALEGVQQDNRVAIEKLEQSGSTADIILADKLKKENLEIQGNIDLAKMGVANEYDLAKMDKAHEQATELNTTNNALREKLANMDNELAERRLQLDAIKAEVDRAQGQRKIELQEQALAMEAEMNTFEQGYKTQKLALEEAAARLTRLGSNTNARITTLISNPESLARYAAGTMSPEETLEFNQAIAYYNAPKSVWSEEKKQYVIVPGNPLSNELMSSIKIRQESGLTVPNIKLDKITGTGDGEKPDTKEEITSSIMEGITDPTAAFGTEAAAKSVANTVAEIFFFGAPFKAEKEAIAGAEALNTKFVQVFQRSAELRDSVMQLTMLKKLTPDPSSMFMGPDNAGGKITRLLGMIDEAEQALRIKIEDPDSPLTAKQMTEARGYLTDLAQLRAGYTVFDNAYKQGGASQGKVEALRSTLGLGNR